MASYNYLDDIKKIYGLKGEWQNADAADAAQKNRQARAKQSMNQWLGNHVDANYKIANEKAFGKQFGVEDGVDYTTQKNEIANRAKSVYNNLSNNGYSGYANKLQGINYDQAKDFVNKLQKTAGKQEIRPYLYTLGSKYGMSQNEIDKLLNYDNDTQEVSFGGKKIGIAQNNVDGHTYWDADVLDNAFNDYISRSGKKTDEMRYNESNDATRRKLDEQWQGMNDDYKDTRGMYKGVYDAYGLSQDPFKTDWGQSMMASYELDGSKKSDNAIASGAAANGGNIDSFAAANARRARLTEENMGKMMVHNAAMDRINGAKSLLEQLGVYESGHYANQNENIDRETNFAQQLQDRSEERKNNEVARNTAISQITGKIPAQYQTSDNPFYENGQLKNPTTTDFQAFENRMQTIIDDPNASASEKTWAKQQINYARQARQDKILNYGYGQYADTMRPWNTNTESQPAKESRENRESAERISMEGYNLERDKNQKDYDLNNRKMNLEVAENDKQRQQEILMANLNSKLSMDEAKLVAELEQKAKAYDAQQEKEKPILTLDQARSALESGETSQSVIDAYNYWNGTNYTVDNPPGAEKDDSDTNYQSKLDEVYDSSGKTVQAYIRNKLEPFVKQNNVTETELKNHLIENSREYDLEVDDLKAICKAFGIDTKWADNYKNSGFLGWGKGVKEK